MLLRPIEPPVGLEELIAQRIAVAMSRSYTVRKVIFSSLSLGSFVFLALIGLRLYSALSVSGFFGYMNLGLSDMSLFVTFSRELVLSVVESVPVFSLTLFFACSTLFLWSFVRTLSVGRKKMAV